MEVITGPSASFVQQQQQSQPASPISQIGQLLQLKNLRQQQALAPLQLQEAQQRVQQGQLDIQKEQRALKDQEIMSGVIQKWGQPTTTATPGAAQSTAPDYDQLLDMARKSGVSYSTYQGIQQHVLDMKAKAATIAKDDAQTGQDKAGTLVKNNGMIVDALSGVINAPDAEVIPRLSATAQQLQQQGLLDQQHIQMAQQLIQSGDPASARKAVDIYAKTLGGYNKVQEQATKDIQLQQEKGRSDPNSIFYSPTQAAVEMGTAPGARMIQQGQIRLAAAKAGAEQNARIPGELSLAKQKLALGLTDNGTNLTGDAYLQSLPAGMQAQVKAMANGDIAVPSASARNVQAQALRNAVLTYDPSYTDARYKGKQQFKTSGDAQNVMQLATAMEHADRAISNSAKAGFAPALGNKTLESGTSAAYMQDAEFLTGEVGKLVKNGVLTVDEGNKISSGLTSARQGVRDSALHETMDLLGGKSRGLFQKYKNATGQDLPVNEFFDQKSQQRLQKYGIIEGRGGGSAAAGVSVTAPNGKVYSFPDQESANAFKLKAGIQ